MTVAVQLAALVALPTVGDGNVGYCGSHCCCVYPLEKHYTLDLTQDRMAALFVTVLMILKAGMHLMTTWRVWRTLNACIPMEMVRRIPLATLLRSRPPFAAAARWVVLFCSPGCTLQMKGI